MNIDILSVLSGIGIGAILAWILFVALGKNTVNRMQTDLALESEKLRQVHENMEDSKNRLEKKSLELAQAHDELSSLRARLENATDTFKKQDADYKLIKSELNEKSSLAYEYFGHIQKLEAQKES